MRTFYRTMVILLSASVGHAALAQTGEAGRESKRSAASQADITDIIVTAQRREQSLQDVPISIAAIGAQALQSQQVRQLADIATMVPNLSVREANARTSQLQVYIRGIGQTTPQFSQDPSIALYQNGVYVGSGIGAAFDSPDIERVEVLRGPQGTLYGRNATGGAINIIQARPNLDDVDYRAELGFGNYDQRRGAVMVNVPLSDVIAVRGAYSHEKRDGWLKNTGVGLDGFALDRESARAAVRIKPSADFTIDYGFDYFQSKGTQNILQPTGGAAVTAGTFRSPFSAPRAVAGGFVQTFGEFVYANDVPVGSRADSINVTQPQSRDNVRTFAHELTMEHKASDQLTLRSITGYRLVKSESPSTLFPQGTAFVRTRFSPTLAGLPSGTVVNEIGPDPINRVGETTRYHSFSQELQALGTVDLGGVGLDYVAGLYYFEDGGQQDTLRTGVGAGNTFTTGHLDLANRALAAFSELTFTPDAVKDLHVTVGARISHDKRFASRENETSFSYASLGGFTAENCRNVRFAPLFAGIGIDPTNLANCSGVIAAATYNRKNTNFSPALTIAYDFSPDLNAYAKYSVGYKSPSTSSFSANPALFAIGADPERVNSYEVGLKGAFLDRRLRLNVAAFYMDYARQTQSFQTGATAGDRDDLTVRGTKIKGIEADASLRITDALTFSAQGAFTDTSVPREGVSIALDTGAVLNLPFIGELAYVPKYSTNLALDYRSDLSDRLRLDAHVGYAYRSRSRGSLVVAYNQNLTNSNLIDANIGLTFKNAGGIGEVTLRGWVKNLTDDNYTIAALGDAYVFAGATGAVIYGTPRTYGLTLSVRR